MFKVEGSRALGIGGFRPKSETLKLGHRTEGAAGVSGSRLLALGLGFRV